MLSYGYFYTVLPVLFLYLIATRYRVGDIHFKNSWLTFQGCVQTERNQIYEREDLQNSPNVSQGIGIQFELLFISTF